MNPEYAAWFAAVSGTLFTVLLFDRRERGEPLGYAVLVVVASLTVTYWARALEASGIATADPTFYGYTRFAAGCGFSVGVLSTLVGQARARGKPTLVGETTRSADYGLRRAVAAEVANARNARMDAEGGEVTLLTESTRRTDATERLAEAAERDAP